MIVIGIWHAFTLNYLVFGVLQATFLSVTIADPRRADSAEARRWKDKSSSERNLGMAAYVIYFLGAVLTFALMSFRNHLFPFADLGPGHIGRRPDLWPHAKRVDRLVRYPGLSYRARVDLHGDRALCRHRTSRHAKAQLNRWKGCSAMAAIQCLLIHAHTLVDCREWSFIYGQF